MKTYDLATTLAVNLIEGNDHELEAKLTFKVYPGAAPTLEEPGHEATADLVSVHVEVASGEWVAVPEWMFGLFYSDEALISELLDVAADADEYRRDQAADARREEQRMERF